jgi:hypothetical protein
VQCAVWLQEEPGNPVISQWRRQGLLGRGLKNSWGEHLPSSPLQVGQVEGRVSAEQMQQPHGCGHADELWASMWGLETAAAF